MARKYPEWICRKCKENCHLKIVTEKKELGAMFGILCPFNIKNPRWEAVRK